MLPANTNAAHGTVDGDDILKHCGPEFAEMLALWRDKCGPAALPARHAFSFLDLRPWLGQIILFDVLHGKLDDGADFRYRLIGSHHTLTLGIDPTGQRVSEFCLTIDPASALKNLREIVRNRLPRYRSNMMPCSDGRSFTPARLFLPLSESGYDVDMIMLYGGAPRERDGTPRRLDGLSAP